jgi:hypothetical protein
MIGKTDLDHFPAELIGVFYLVRSKDDKRILEGNMLRFTEAQLAAHQKRIAGGVSTRMQQKVKNDEYDLAKYIVDALELGLIKSPASPLIVTLQYGLKQVQSSSKPQSSKKSPVPYERIEQAIALLWLECTDVDSFEVTTAIPFGGYRPDGAGGQIKGEGAKKGYPDVLVDKPSNGYHGLRIEMKKYCPNAHPTEEQDCWLKKLSRNGYRVALCRGHKSAIQVFSSYLGIPTSIKADDLPAWAITYY